MIDKKLAIASVSLDQHSSHTLHKTVVAATQNGISGLEMIYPDLETYAESLSVPIRDTTEKIRRICSLDRITIPSPALKGSLRAAWLRMPSTYVTDIIQIVRSSSLIWLPQQALEDVRRVDTENIGLYLDSFHIIVAL